MNSEAVTLLQRHDWEEEPNSFGLKWQELNMAGWGWGGELSPSLLGRGGLGGQVCLDVPFARGQITKRMRFIFENRIIFGCRAVSKQRLITYIAGTPYRAAKV